MKKLIRNIIFIGLIVVVSGVVFTVQRAKQNDEPVTWELIGEGLRETEDKAKEVYDSTMVKVDETVEEIEDGYEKKDQE